MLRGLIHYWRINLAVLGAATIATAVLIGAVVVGDTMRHSLRQLTLDRLGAIDWALVTEQPFDSRLRASLDLALRATRSDDRSVHATFLVSSSAVHASSRALAGGVSLLGVDEGLETFYEGQEATAITAGTRRESGQLFPPVVLNRSLARELGAAVGDSVLFNFEQTTDIPRESLLGSQPAEPELAGLRTQVAAIVADRGPGRFTLTPHQSQPLLAFVDLEVLQNRLDRPEQANTLFVSTGADELTAEQLESALRSVASLSDLGLEWESTPQWTRISNRRFVLRPTTADRLLALADRAGAQTQPVLGYLANELRVDDRAIPYSMILGLETPVDTPLGTLETTDGAAIGPIPDGEIVLGEWAAEDLGASPGDELVLTYYEVGQDDRLTTRTTGLRVGAIAAMGGLMTDDHVLPDFPGIAEADDIAAWEPPFPMDLGRIRSIDEEFWDRYGAAPKAIVNLATAQRLWSNRFGTLTAIRIAGDREQTDTLLGALREDLEPITFGMAFRPVRQQGLDASAGATDFAGLFLAFSFFLIIAAALVVSLLFTLSVELRAKEVGLRRAVGFPLVSVRRSLLAEGMVVATLGALLGVGMGIAYAALLTDALSSLWAPLVDLPLLSLELVPGNIVAAGLGSLLLVMVTITLALRRLRRVPIPSLLSGGARAEARGRSVRRPLVVAATAATLAIGVLLIAVLSGSGSSAAAFFSAGALLLIAGLAAFSAWVRGPSRVLSSGAFSAAGIAARNNAFNPSRSLLSVALVACAAFMLVSVAANRRELRAESLGRSSGTGGFTLVAETTVPIRSPIDGEANDLGLGDDTWKALESASVFPLRLLPGEDASCLNLYQPEKPRVAAVSDDFIERGGFAFTSLAEPVDNPWTLLQDDLGEGVIPAIGDANSVTWILHSGLGKDIELTNDLGQPVKLRLVGLLAKSIFQSELVISEKHFLEHFPQHGGYSYFLIETPAADPVSIAASLEEELGAYGFDATSTVDKLARFLGIEEMYLSTFQLLGGLGLILGTLGLGVVLIRNVNERRGELATLRAFGFRRRSIASMVFLETFLQLLIGLVIGTTAGFLALTPYILDSSLHLPWGDLGLTLLIVVVAGLLSTTAGVAAALRTPLLPALKAD